MAKPSVEMAEEYFIPVAPVEAPVSLKTTSHPVSPYLSALILVISDIAAVLGALFLAFLIRIHILPLLSSDFYPQVPHGFFNRIWLVLAITICCLAFEGLYTKRLSFWQETKMVLKSITLAFLFVMAAIFLEKIAGEISRTTLLLGYIIIVFLLPLTRYISKKIMLKTGLWMEPVIIMGAGNTGEMIAGALIRDTYPGYRVLGFLEDDPAKRTTGITVNGINLPILGRFADAVRVIKGTGVRHLIMATPRMPGPEKVALTNQLQPHLRSLVVVPDLFGMPVMDGETEYFFDEQILAFRTRNNLAHPLNRIIKRLFDLVAGTIIMVLILPIMAVIALIIRIDSPGPIIFSHNRIGHRGREFKCHKFRTMYLNNDEILNNFLTENPEALEEWERFAKIKGNDPRVTRAGNWLRKYSLDELPQIFDVLIGQMSLVGPRPYLPRERLRMGYKASSILLTRPGITGLWQVSGRNEIDFEGRLQLESWYVHNWSLWFDISLLFRTIGVVLKREGAY